MDLATQPVWLTEAGTLGTYSGGTSISIKLNAKPVLPATQVFFKLLGGDLPEGEENQTITIDNYGYIKGVTKNIPKEKTSVFTVRLVDDRNNIKDRTFSLTISGYTGPKITTNTGSLLTILDSTYVKYQIQHINSVKTNNVSFNIASGTLPPGLRMSNSGLITGYPDKPVTANKSPTTITYTFTVQLRSNLGNDLVAYSITIINQRLNNPPNTRVPTVLNKRPLIEPIPAKDPFLDYYFLNNKKIPTIKANQYFSFKIIGYDFDNNDLIYQYNGLPPGLVGDPNTGWVYGSPLLADNTLSKFETVINVAKKHNPTLVSPDEKFVFTITNNIKEDIEWVTDSNLGTINNGTISTLVIEATATEELIYKIDSGSLPGGLELLKNGQLIGSVGFQPKSELLTKGDSSTYTFVVEAYNRDNLILNSTKEFVLVVNQMFEEPFETVYLKASPPIEQKIIINRLLSDENLIPSEYLYRANDRNFGKSNEVRVAHAFGVRSSRMDQYIEFIKKNHYWRKIVLGPIQTAVATDIHGNVLYEVVYSKVIDDLENTLGVGLPQEIIWKTPINYNSDLKTINNSNVLIDSTLVSTNTAPKNLRKFNPAGIQNMRAELIANTYQNTDNELLPKWMTSQQYNGNTLGFVLAWVICYTKQGYAEEIKNRINEWEHKLNEIDFTVDRYVVDKSNTFNYNNKFIRPIWTNLPSNTPVPNPIDRYDICVLFPKKTILPTDNQ